MKADAITSFLDKFLSKQGRASLPAVEAARLLDRAGILKDRRDRPGKPLRDMLRKGLLPHAYQIGGKGSEWVIPAGTAARSSTRSTPHGSKPPSSKESAAPVSSDDYFEGIRAQYRPADIRVLFIGESRPSGCTFFYLGNSILFDQTYSAFRQLLDRDFETPGEFLRDFSDRGFFLDDLCDHPVNGLDPKPRQLARDVAIPSLADRIKSYSPEAIICVIKSIKPQVMKAVDSSGISLAHPLVFLPFPAWGRDIDYQNGIQRSLREFGYF